MRARRQRPVAGTLRMLQGIRTVIISVAAAAVAGAIFGLLVGSLMGEILIAMGIGAFVGANFGLAIGYGYLPESEADLESEEQASA